MNRNNTSRTRSRLAGLACILLALGAVLGGCSAVREAAKAPDVQESLSGSVPGDSVPSIAYETDGSTVEMQFYDGDGFYGEDPVEFNTEEYAAVSEGKFTNAATRPLSTLSADVDTASYCNLRRMLGSGSYPEDIPAGAVRIEEMLNYFTYDYALPSGDDLFGTTVQVADCPWNPSTKLLVMGFATSPEAAEDTKGSNLVFLVDVSGSMDSYDKLGLLKDAFGELVDKLGPDDRVSIVTYANGEEVVLEGAHGDDRRTIMRAIGSLSADGATNGEAGLRMAYRLAHDNYIDGGVNRIILASDGDLNVGMTSESDLEEYVSKQRDSGIYLSVLGFGSGNYKDTKMETIADNGNGSYHYIDCIDEAVRVFGENLTANLVPLADDVKLQVEFNPATVKGYRLIGYENRALADEEFRDDAADAGDVGPGHQFTVAYEIALAGSDQEIAEMDLKYDTKAAEGATTSDEWLTCTMRYRPAGEEHAQEQEFAVGPADLSAVPSDDWRFAAAVIEAGMLLRDSEYVGDATFEDVAGLLVGCDTDPLRKEFATMVSVI